jgi:hypothetical protein
MRIQTAILALLTLSGIGFGQSPLPQAWKSVTGPKTSGSGLSTDTIGAGLKEALKVSTTKAVAATGKPDGFLGNPAIRIPLPGKLQSARHGLRLVGMGPQLDELEVGMNRAAERAAPLAKQIFLDALMKMTISDARNILGGGDTAATQYFRGASSEELSTAFTPIVHNAMQSVGVAREYDQVMQNSVAAPFMKSRNVDLDAYVVGKTLDGLFYMLGQEEKQIRKNPAAQTSAILQEVFGHQQPDGGR